MIARLWRGWAANTESAVAPRARELLARFEPRCIHSELVIETAPPEQSK